MIYWHYKIWKTQKKENENINHKYSHHLEKMVTPVPWVVPYDFVCLHFCFFYSYYLLLYHYIGFFPPLSLDIIWKLILMAISFSQLIIYLAISLPVGLVSWFSTFCYLKYYCHKHPHIESLNLFQPNLTIRTECIETRERERGFFRLLSAHLCLLGNCNCKEVLLWVYGSRRHVSSEKTDYKRAPLS